jgi:hypothetical protein
MSAHLHPTPLLSTPRTEVGAIAKDSADDTASDIAVDLAPPLQQTVSLAYALAPAARRRPCRALFSALAHAPLTASALVDAREEVAK